jgi:hypothetical protein
MHYLDFSPYGCKANVLNIQKSADFAGKFWMIIDLGGLLVEFLALKVEKSV